MNHYELSYIIAGDTPENKIKDWAKQVSETVKDNGGEAIEENIIGRENLSYPIQKHMTGIYVQLFFDMNPEKASQIAKNLNSLPFVIRFVVSGIQSKKPQVVLRAKQKAKESIPAKETAEVPAESKSAKLEIDEEKTTKKSPVLKEKAVKLTKKETVKEKAEKPEIKKSKKTTSEITKNIETEEQRLKQLDEKIEELLKE